MLSDPVLVAVIVSVQGIAVAWLNKKGKLTRAKVDTVQSTVNQVHGKLETNTKLTIEAASSASAAVDEANSFSRRLLVLEHDLKSSVEKLAGETKTVETELGRLSRNVHAIANALTPLVGRLELEKRDAEKSR
jgi:cob(I)alamin adenosyltransferase